MSAPDPIALLTALVEAHDVVNPRTGQREYVMYVRTAGGGRLRLEDPPAVDDAVVEELHAQGLIDIDYRQHNWNITPTERGRALVEQHKRVLGAEPVADTSEVLAAVAAQAQKANKLEWSAVRPVLGALRDYWEAGGFSEHGVQLMPLLKAVPDEHFDLFRATIRALVNDDYLLPTTDLAITGALPAEVAVGPRAHAVLDRWPGASAEETVKNLLAVLDAGAAQADDPARKRRFQAVAQGIRELGVDLASEVIAKTITS